MKKYFSPGPNPAGLIGEPSETASELNPLGHGFDGSKSIPKTGKSKEDQLPVLIVKNKKGRLVHVGQPDAFDKRLLAEYAQIGHSLKTITIKMYRKNIHKWKWYWEK